MSWAETLFLKKVIDGKKRFAVSDNVLTIINNEEVRATANSNQKTFPKKFVSKTNGVIRVKYTLKGTSSTNAILRILVNGEEIEYIKKADANYTSYNSSIDVKKGDIVSFELVNYYCNYIAICADIIDGSTFDIKED